MEPADQEPSPDVSAGGEPSPPVADDHAADEPETAETPGADTKARDPAERPDDADKPLAAEKDEGLGEDEDLDANDYAVRTVADRRKRRDDDMRRTGLDETGWKTRSSIESEGNGNLNNITSVTIQSGGSTRTAWSAPLPKNVAVRRINTYVHSSSHRLVVRLLSEEWVAFLCGPRQGGLPTTAYAVLAELCGVENIREIDLARGVKLAQATADDVLLPGCGHVLEVGPDTVVTRVGLGQLAETARERRAYVVVIGPPVSKIDAFLEPYVLWHTNPPGHDVLSNTLFDLLAHDDICVGDCTQCDHTCRHRYVTTMLSDPEIAQYLAETPPPAEVVDLAHRLLETHREGLRPAEALGRLYGRIRDLAVDLIAPKKKEGERRSEARSRRLLHESAFRIAYSLFNGYQLSMVFDVARPLFDALSLAGAPHRTPLTGVVLDGNVGALLGEGMTRGNAEQPGSLVANLDRRAELVEPRLGQAMLDVLWNDFDQTRAPMIEWVLFLGQHLAEEARRRAATAAVHFARYDLLEVYRQIIRRWALSTTTRTRWTAAYAMDLLAEFEPVRVRGQISDWTKSPNLFMNDAAARAYAIASWDIPAESAIADLRRLADRNGHTVSFAVPLAMARIAEQAKDSGAVLETLVDWSSQERRCVEVQAARTALLLTRLADDVRPTLPSLLCQAHADPVIRERLVTLWRHALSNPLVARQAWPAARSWLSAVRSDDVLRPWTVEFFGEVLEVQPLRLRTLFYLGQWKGNDDDDVLAELRRRLGRAGA